MDNTEERNRMLRERQVRDVRGRLDRKVKQKVQKPKKENLAKNVRDRLDSRIRQKYNQSKRDKQLNSIRQQQEQSHQREIGIFDFVLDFGVLC